jgi:hypothetical protein
MIRKLRSNHGWLRLGPRQGSSAQATGGVPPSVPFTGELMVCVVCGQTEHSDPTKNTDWRAIDLDGQRAYACPHEFPPADLAAFEAAYLKVFNAAVARHRS